MKPQTLPHQTKRPASILDWTLGGLAEVDQYQKAAFIDEDEIVEPFSFDCDDDY